MSDVGRHDYRACSVDDCEHCQTLIENGTVIVCDECGRPGDNHAPGGWVQSDEALIFCSQCARELNLLKDN